MRTVLVVSPSDGTLTGGANVNTFQVSLYPGALRVVHIWFPPGSGGACEVTPALLGPNGKQSLITNARRLISGQNAGADPTNMPWVGDNVQFDIYAGDLPVDSTWTLQAVVANQQTSGYATCAVWAEIA